VSAKQKSQKGFVAVTLITVLAIALVIVVYATILGTFTGGNVTVVAVQGTVYYSSNNTNGWATGISDHPITAPWYARFNVTSTNGYSGPVKVIWNLYNSTSAILHNLNTTTSLTGSTQTIYASSDGSQGSNYNWGLNTAVADTYHLVVIVETTS
jgi:hypothetical protein